MKVVQIKSIHIRIPLKEPLGVGSWWNENREFVLVLVHTDDGIAGTGFTYGGYYPNQGRLIALAIEDHLGPLLLGEDPRRTEYLWEKMYRRHLMMSRRGALVWALSALDIALWDIKAKVAGEPLFRLLGGFREDILAYGTCGYYRKDWTLSDLAREIERHLSAGLKALKLKVGRLEPEEDAERVRIARETMGPRIRLAIDANNGWKNAYTAIKAVRLMEKYDLWWVEEPIELDDLRGAAQLADAIDPPVVNGEQAVTRWDHRELVQRGAAEILQLDATMCGGISEWMRSAHMAQAFDISVLPVWFHNLHIHLAAAAPNCFAAEYFLPSEGTFPFEDLLEERLPMIDGVLRPSYQPGHGIVFNAKNIEKYRVS